MQTKKQRQNTAILTLFVHNLPNKVKNENFNMLGLNGFGDDCGATPFQAQGMTCLLNNPTPSKTPKCGTSGCFCGWGPAAGIKPIKKESWLAYAQRQFGATYEDYYDKVWNTLFEAKWGGTADDAAKRGAWLIQTGTTLSINDCPGQFDDFKPNWKFIKAVAEGKM